MASGMVERVARAIQDIDVVARGKDPISDEVWAKLWGDAAMRATVEPYARAAIEAMRWSVDANVFSGLSGLPNVSVQDWNAVIDAALKER